MTNPAFLKDLEAPKTLKPTQTKAPAPLTYTMTDVMKAGLRGGVDLVPTETVVAQATLKEQVVGEKMTELNPDTNPQPQVPQLTDDGASLEEQLLDAARRDNTDVIQALIQQGVNVNVLDGSGNAALHHSCMCNGVASCHALVQAPSVNLNLTNRTEWDTPLHKAVAADAIDCVEVLLAAGATKSLNVRNKHKQTPADLAVAKPQIRALLEQASFATKVGNDEIVQENEGDEEDD